MWPSLFVEEVASVLSEKPDRFTISTHTIAMVPTLEDLIDNWKRETEQETTEEEAKKEEEKRAAYERLQEAARKEVAGRTILPRKIYREAKAAGDDVFWLVSRIPSLFEKMSEEEGETAANRRSLYERSLRTITGHNIERYYAMVMMDGDNMGAWVSGEEEEYLLRARDYWHPTILDNLLRMEAEIDAIRKYMDCPLPASPARHKAISSSLNSFSLYVAPAIIERKYNGKIIYAGGDDLMAMLSIRDLMPAMIMLRDAYSSEANDEESENERKEGLRIQFRKGYLLLEENEGDPKKKLLTLMGRKATASMGAVIAHYSTPIAVVIRELRTALERAKEWRLQGGSGKNAFSIALIRRSGGTTYFTSSWSYQRDGETINVARIIEELRREIGSSMTRRAAYDAREWLDKISDFKDEEQAIALITGIFKKHYREGADHQRITDIVRRLACISAQAEDRAAYISCAIDLAEFLARGGRI